MGNMNYQSMPMLMKEQKEEGKKDRYIEITENLLSVKPEELEKEEKLNYMEALADTLDFMDFQIYELYRSLQDRLVLLIKELTSCSYLKEENQKDRLVRLTQRAIEKGFLLKEQVESLFTEEKEKKDFSGLPEELTLKLLHVTARSATLQICGAGLYHTTDQYEIYVDGVKAQDAKTVVCSIYDLKPEHSYDVVVVNVDKKVCGKISVTTRHESVTLNVKQYGAKGDGVQDDTKFIQAAILSCPKDGRVLIPKGVYSITSLFLKSGVNIELEKNAELRAMTDRTQFPIFAGTIPLSDGSDEYNLGTWEGNPLPMYAGIITGVEISDVTIYGEGIVSGNASKEDWWKNPKQMNGAYRPRLFYINHCNHVVLQGVTLKNSPSWTIHPYFSDDLGFYNVNVQNPSDSPNTDGLDPESCRRVEIAGVKFSLGDDCIAVKSGKIYMGKKCKQPSEDIHIHHCLMENGHGAVTVGSEMAGGVKSLIVEDCVFSHTDRGLRIKTRRGRGKDAILDQIVFRRIDMDHVMTPFVANSFYFCDPDGKTEYVQSREAYPVDDRTPYIKTLIFEDIDAKNCHVAAAYLEGLPEQKIDEIVMRNIKVGYAENPKCDVPAMSNGVDACTRKGIFARNIKKIVLDNVSIEGQDGDAVILEEVDEINK